MSAGGFSQTPGRCRPFWIAVWVSTIAVAPIRDTVLEGEPRRDLRAQNGS